MRDNLPDDWFDINNFKLCAELQEIADLVKLEEKERSLNKLAYLILFNFYYDYMNFLDEQKRKK